MKIIVAGAGEIGQHLALKLANEEQQDITLMDSDARLLEKISAGQDMLTYSGNPTDAHDLKECGIEDADLFISVMNEEHANILACMMANDFGVRETMARVSNPGYLGQEYARFFHESGVKSLIYPEELAAEEINTIMLNPWARKYIELVNGMIALVGVKVRFGCEIVGKRLSELTMPEEKMFHVVAVKRDSETIIPKGETRIEHGDIVFFTALANDIDAVRQLCGKQNVTVKKVLIMGASDIALRAIDKASRGIHFVVIEEEKERIEKIRNWLPQNVTLFHGDGRNTALLSEVGIASAQVFVALTGNSETNILACLAAKRFGIFKTIAQEENVDYIPLAEKLDIGTIINRKVITSGHIYRILLGQDTNTVKSLTIANADVAEVVARRGAPIVGKRVSELHLPEGVTLGGMVRNGVPRMIDGDTVIEPYDLVVVFCYNVPMARIRKLFEA